MKEFFLLKEANIIFNEYFGDKAIKFKELNNIKVEEAKISIFYIGFYDGLANNNNKGNLINKEELIKVFIEQFDKTPTLIELDGITKIHQEIIKIYQEGFKNGIKTNKVLENL